MQGRGSYKVVELNSDSITSSKVTDRVATVGMLQSIILNCSLLTCFLFC